MRVGVVTDLNRAAGGAYQYTISLLRALDCPAGEHSYEFTLFTDVDGEAPELRPENPAAWRCEPFAEGRVMPRPMDRLRRLVGEGPHRELWRRLRRTARPQSAPVKGHVPPVHYQPAFRDRFARSGMGVLMYTVPSALAFEIQIPSVMPVHDLQHRLQPEFPEVSQDGEWERREYLYRNAARHDTLLIADSEVGREDLLTCYAADGLTPDRVHVLPFLPASGLDAGITPDSVRLVRERHGLPAEFLFYPAQFWPHKNHARLVEALAHLESGHGLKPMLVLVGSHSGELRERTFEEVMALARRLGVDGRVRYLGYVPDDEIAALYAGAAALVMPTFFGPTNIPILEAWAHGCPVLTSDLRGIREQAGEAAVLVDPRSVEALAEGVARILTDSELRTRLELAGRLRLGQYTPEDHRRRLFHILDEATWRVQRRAPGSPR